MENLSGDVGEYIVTTVCRSYVSSDKSMLSSSLLKLKFLYFMLGSICLLLSR